MDYNLSKWRLWVPMVITMINKSPKDRVVGPLPNHLHGLYIKLLPTYKSWDDPPSRNVFGGQWVQITRLYEPKWPVFCKIQATKLEGQPPKKEVSWVRGIFFVWGGEGWSGGVITWERMFFLLEVGISTKMIQLLSMLHPSQLLPKWHFSGAECGMCELFLPAEWWVFKLFVEMGIPTRHINRHEKCLTYFFLGWTRWLDFSNMKPLGLL